MSNRVYVCICGGLLSFGCGSSNKLFVTLVFQKKKTFVKNRFSLNTSTVHFY